MPESPKPAERGEKWPQWPIVGLQQNFLRARSHTVSSSGAQQRCEIATQLPQKLSAHRTRVHHYKSTTSSNTLPAHFFLLRDLDSASDPMNRPPHQRLIPGRNFAGRPRGANQNTSTTAHSPRSRSDPLMGLQRNPISHAELGPRSLCTNTATHGAQKAHRWTRAYGRLTAAPLKNSYQKLPLSAAPGT